MDIILNHGKVGNAPGGAMKVSMGKKQCQEIVGEMKRAIQLVDKARGGHIIFKDNWVLTVYK